MFIWIRPKIVFLNLRISLSVFNMVFVGFDMHIYKKLCLDINKKYVPVHTRQCGYNVNFGTDSMPPWWLLYCVGITPFPLNLVSLRIVSCFCFIIIIFVFISSQDAGWLVRIVRFAVRLPPPPHIVVYAPEQCAIYSPDGVWRWTLSRTTASATSGMRWSIDFNSTCNYLVCRKLQFGRSFT